MSYSYSILTLYTMFPALYRTYFYVCQIAVGH